MPHPWASLPAHRRRPVFGVLLALTLVVMAVLNLVDGPLKTKAAPQGIVSFELAGNVSTASDIVQSWTPAALPHAGFSLGFDFVFMVAYALTIGLACLWAAEVLGERYPWAARLGVGLAWGQVLAALLDATENVALLVTLLDAPRAPWPQIAAWCAGPKFGLVLLGLLYAALGFGLGLSRKLARRTQ